MYAAAVQVCVLLCHLCKVSFDGGHHLLGYLVTFHSMTVPDRQTQWPHGPGKTEVLQSLQQLTILNVDHACTRAVARKSTDHTLCTREYEQWSFHTSHRACYTNSCWRQAVLQGFEQGVPRHGFCHNAHLRNGDIGIRPVFKRDGAVWGYALSCYGQHGL